MKFLNNLDLRFNQLQNAVIHLVPGISGLSGTEGQIAYDTTTKDLYIYRDSAWTRLATTIVATEDPATGIQGEIYFNTTDGILKVYNGSIWTSIGKTVEGGTKVTVVEDSTSYTVNHDGTTRTNTTSSQSPAHGATVNVVDSISSDATGHITGVNTKTVTLPTYDISTIDNVGSATIRLSDSVSGTDDIALVGGTDINVDATDTSTINIEHANISRTDTSDSSGVEFGGSIDVVDSITTSATGHVTAINVKTITLPDDSISAVAGVGGAIIRLSDDANPANTDDVLLTNTNGTIDISTTNDSEIEITHGNTSDQASVTGLTGQAVISGVTLDDYGHITQLNTRNLELADIGEDGITLQTVTDEGSTTTNAIEINNATSSTNTLSGALIVDGGVGIGENVYIGGLLDIVGSARIGGDLTVEGTVTSIDSTTVNIGDNNILLNNDLATSAANSDGGITVKRLNTNDESDISVELSFNNTNGRWTQDFGPATEAPRTSVLPIKLSYVLNSALDDVSLNGTEYTVTHNLNTRDIIVTLREVGADYEVIYTDIEFPTANTALVRFAVAPAEGAYTLTLIG